MYLNAHTYYSLRYGTLSPQQLVAAAVAHQVEVLALTDINNTSCSFEFVEACKAAGIRPLLGIEFRQDNELLYIGLAKNKEGFRILNQFLTQHAMESKALPKVPPPLKEVFIIYPHPPKPIGQFEDWEFIGIRPKQVDALYSSPLKAHLDKLVILSPITFLDREGYRTHALLRAIDENTLVTKLDPKQLAKSNEHFHPPSYLKQCFENYPQIILNTNDILNSCKIEFETGVRVNRHSFTGSKASDYQLLCKLAHRGFRDRYHPHHRQAFERMQRELEVIHKLGFCCYFLITWDIVRYAQNAGYYHVGRGSGANSIVAYCLYITDVEPIELDLYFERFINQFRTSPPDFDIDFSWDERDDVTDYIFKRYGHEHTALLATYNTFKGKSVIRELGKVFGLPKAEIDKIIDEPLAVDEHHELAQKIIQYGENITGLPNYLSIHAGGILISEHAIHYHTALQLMPKGFPITHFDMYGAERRGFHKFDILSQRGLGHIKDAVTLIKYNQGKEIDIRNIEQIKQDKKTRAQLQSGKCMGCFYIESPAMRGLLSKLGCDNYLHLVAASSIIRPGVAKSGMMREYIRRFHQSHSFTYLHPVFEENLKETFGVMVYQEDVMKIVHHFGGLRMDEADVLRRMMAGKRQEGDSFDEMRKKYFENCRNRNYDETLSQEVWRQVESFSGYSFCKAHSASFAAESFQSLYLKAYYPLEFMVAVINNFGGFYRAEYYFHEARVCGANIHPPCVNHSLYLTTIEGQEIYIGFIHLHQMEKRVAHRIVGERAKGGIFHNLEDFCKRVAISGEQLDILIRIGAFRFTGLNKYELVWQKNAVFNPEVQVYESGFLFDEMAETFSIPQLVEGPFDQAFDEIELLGFPLCSPFDLLAIKNQGDITAHEFKKYLHKKVVILGYYVCRKAVSTVNRKRMSFGTWIDRSGKFFDTTHFPPSLKRSPFRGKGCYLITGKVVSDFNFLSIEVIEMQLLPFVKDERYAE